MATSDLPALPHLRESYFLELPYLRHWRAREQHRDYCDDCSVLSTDDFCPEGRRLDMAVTQAVLFTRGDAAMN